jgi:hypothetical protein
MPTPHTSDLNALPDVTSLKRLMQSLAVLDTIISPEWDYRYYSFIAQWSAEEEMGSMRNGSGDDLFALFSAHGCLLKGFAHESSKAQVDPGFLYSQLPAPFSKQVHEPAISPANVTFLYWRGLDDAQWHSLPIPNLTGAGDGSEDLLKLLDGDPASYRAFAAEYYERELPLDAIERIYAHEPLSPSIAELLNSDLDWGELRSEIDEIGYAVA